MDNIQHYILFGNRLVCILFHTLCLDLEILENIQFCMSHNVSGIRRFASPYKGFAKQSPGLAKCDGEKLHKGASADCSFSESGGGKAAGAYTVCYAKYDFSLIEIYKHYLE